MGDPTDLNRLAVRHVPLLVTLDATGALIGVRVGVPLPPTSPPSPEGPPPPPPPSGPG